MSWADDPISLLDLSSDSTVLEFLESVEGEADDRHRMWRADARMNLAWVSGRQDVELNGDSLSVNPFYLLYKDVPAIHTNYLRRVVLQQIVRVAGSSLTFAAIPMRPDETSIARGKVGDRLLDHTWTRTNMDSLEKVGRLMHYVVCTGCGFVETTWNTGVGAKRIIKGKDINDFIANMAGGDIDLDASAIDPKEMFQTLMDTIAPGLSTGRMIRTGDGDIVYRDGFPQIRTLSGFNVIEDWTADTSDDWQWCVVREFIDPLDAIKDYPDIPHEHLNARDTMSSLSDSTPRLQGNAFDFTRRPSIIRYRIWTRPTDRKRPNRFVCVINGHVVDRREGDDAYAHRQIPIVRVDDSPECFDVRPTALVTDLRVLQAEYNYLKNQVARWVRESQRPETIASKGQIRNKRKWADPSHSVREYYPNPMAPPPTPWQVAPIPADIFRHIAVLQDEIRYLGSITDITQGQTSSQATSGRAIIAHTENADRNSALLLKGLVSGLGKVGRQLLGLFGQFMPEKTVIYTMGDGDKTEAIEFIGANFLDIDADGAADALKYDVKVTLGEEASASRVMEFLDWLIARAVLDPIRHSRIIIQAVSTGIMPTDWDPTAQDRLNAARLCKSVIDLSERTKAGKTNPAAEVQERAEEFMPQLADDSEVFFDVMVQTLVKDREVWNDLDPTVREIVLAIAMEHQTIEQQARMSQGTEPGTGDENGERTSPSDSSAA